MPFSNHTFHNSNISLLQKFKANSSYPEHPVPSPKHPANHPQLSRHSNVFTCTTAKSSLRGRSDLLRISPSCESSAVFWAKCGFKLHMKRYSKIHQSQTSHPPENRNRSEPHSLAITSYIISLRAAPFYCALVNSFMGFRSKVQRQEEGSRKKSI